jgi:hypothetical protein
MEHIKYVKVLQPNESPPKIKRCALRGCINIAKQRYCSPEHCRLDKKSWTK